MNNYIHLLISVVHPAYGMTINRYCLGIDINDPLLHDFDIDHWAEPETRNRLLNLLCEDWLSDGCSVVGCEQIAGAVQWQRVGSDQ
jgi:hypothetical protein